MTEQWQELKETIIEMRDNDGTCTQQEVCKFLVNYMGVLEKQMSKPCGDAISRQQAIDKMQELENEDIEAYGCAIPEGFDGQRAIERLKTLPSIQPEPKTGHWIWEHDEHYGTDIKTCSECGASYQHFDFTNYCPNCGKRMIR